MILLDSNVIIYATKPEYESVRNYIATIEPAVSVISKIEVLGYHKLSQVQRIRLQNLFQTIPVLPVTEDVVAWAITLRQRRRISLGDALIAGTALAFDLSLCTANVKDYAWIEELDLINPLEMG